MLWEEGSTLIPKKPRLARGLRKSYFDLRRQSESELLHITEAELPVYREGNLYNIYSKQLGAPQQLDTLELNAQDRVGHFPEDEVMQERAHGPDVAEASEQLFRRRAREAAPRL